MKLKIDVETRTFVRFWLVVTGFAAAILAIVLARNALILIGIALFLALALNPPVSWLARRLPGKSRIGATGIAYLTVITLLGTIVLLVVPPIIEQTARFAETVPGLIDKATSQRPVLEDFIARNNLQGAVDQAIENAKQQAGEASKQLGTVLVNVVTGAFGWLANMAFILVLSFFMLVEGPMWMSRLWGLYRDQDKLSAHKATVEKMYHVVTGFVNGQITVATIGATFVFFALLAMSLIQGLNMPANLALPLAVIVLIFEVIPMIGATLATVVTVLVLLLNSPTAALVFGIVYILYQQIENNVIAPRIQAKNVELSVIWIIMALLIGSSIFGFIGGLISIPIAGCIRILFMDYLERAQLARRKHRSAGRVEQFIEKIRES